MEALLKALCSRKTERVKKIKQRLTPVDFGPLSHNKTFTPNPNAVLKCSQTSPFPSSRLCSIVTILHYSVVSLNGNTNSVQQHPMDPIPFGQNSKKDIFQGQLGTSRPNLNLLCLFFCTVCVIIQPCTLLIAIQYDEYGIWENNKIGRASCRERVL